MPAYSDDALFEAAKEHLNVTIDDDDAQIARLIAAAKAHVERQLGYALDDPDELPDGPPEDLMQAILLLVGHWYENREASVIGVIPASVPFGLDEIIREHRTYTFG
jgi:hypothetical protein